MKVEADTKENALASGLASAEELIEEARQGRMLILVDDEDRENEGDLVLPAGFADADAINFMVTHGRGLVCLALTADQIAQLELPMMAATNDGRFQTAFTVSIEAREGVTTGISAGDRARTIAVAINPQTRRHDISTPGHVFPLLARDGGVLTRAGHTEAAVDLARLADQEPAGVICEIMNPDGTMARLPDLLRFGQEHGMKVGTIASLIAYRRRKDTRIECVQEQLFQSEDSGSWSARLYINHSENTEHLALVKGELDGESPILVRMHKLAFLDDALGKAGGRAGLLRASMRAIAEVGSGAIVIIRHTQSGQFTELLSSEPIQGGSVLRDYGVGAQILRDIGIRTIIMLTNSPPRTPVALDGYGLSIAGYRKIKTG